MKSPSSGSAPSRGRAFPSAPASDAFLKARSILGKSTFSGKRYALYKLDCIKGLQKLAKENLINLILTSPPYNINVKYNQHKDSMDADTYRDFCVDWMKACAQALAANGSMWLNVGHAKAGDGCYVPLTYLLYPNLPPQLTMKQEIVWYSSGGGTTGFRKSLKVKSERIMWLVRSTTDFVFNSDDPRVRERTYIMNDKRNATSKPACDVWLPPHPKYLKNSPATLEAKQVLDDEAREDLWIDHHQVPDVDGNPKPSGHPAQMPIAVAMRIAVLGSNAGDLVLDPFNGVGTTGVAALRFSNRFYIGFDVDVAYLAQAHERLKGYD